jgi:phage shock protein E
VQHTKTTLAAVLTVVTLLTVACGASKPKSAQESGHGLVSPAEFAKVMAEPGTVTLNVLGADAPRIPGTDLEIALQDLASSRSQLPPTSTTLAVYCWSGHTSAAAVPVLEQLGYKHIVELEGGMQAWSADGRKLATARSAGHPSAAVRQSMLRAVHERLCFKQNAWLSGSDSHYGLVITQVACGGTYFDHWWLRRKRLSAAAPWTVLDERRGTIDRRAGCTRAKRVPADIRCK